MPKKAPPSTRPGPVAVDEIIARLRRQQPLVHHLTNGVVMNDQANAALALGALPVMAQAVEEAAEVAAGAQAVLLNLGTLSPERLMASLLAGQEANRRAIPVVLDPVGAGVSTWRTAAARRVLNDVQVSIIRCNRAEAAALLGRGGEIRGVEDTAVADDVERVNLARTLAASLHAVAAITGARDVISDGTRVLEVQNGHPMLKRITGSGCMAGTLVACCAAVEADGLLAAGAGLAVMGVAGERAAARAEGPGSFHVALFDEMSRISRHGCAGQEHVLWLVAEC